MPAMDAARDAGWTGVQGAAADLRSGAAEIALRAAEALAALPPSDLPDAVRTLLGGHPSMAPLWRLGTEVLTGTDHRDAAAGFARRILAERDAVAEAAAPLLGHPVLVLHSYSSALAAAVSRTGARALCARSEPGGEGSVMALRLQAAGLRAELVEDEDALSAARAGAPVVTGADAVGPGGVVNKVRTAALAEAAGTGGGGCFALAGGSKLVAADLPAPQPFERIPMHLFWRVVTEEGALEPRAAAAEAARFPLHPLLAELL
jgi:hypothetical protein